MGKFTNYNIFINGNFHKLRPFFGNLGVLKDSKNCPVTLFASSYFKLQLSSINEGVNLENKFKSKKMLILSFKNVLKISNFNNFNFEDFLELIFPINGT